MINRLKRLKTKISIWYREVKNNIINKIKVYLCKKLNLNYKEVITPLTEDDFNYLIKSSGVNQYKYEVSRSTTIERIAYGVGIQRTLDLVNKLYVRK